MKLPSQSLFQWPVLAVLWIMVSIALVLTGIAGNSLADANAIAMQNSSPETAPRAALLPRTVSLVASNTLSTNTLSTTPSGSIKQVLGSSPQNRYTPEAVRRDWLAMDALRASLNAKRRNMDAYAAYKAQFLLDFAVSEYEENDRTGIVTWSLDSASALVLAATPELQRQVAFLALPTDSSVSSTLQPDAIAPAGLEINPIPEQESATLHQLRQRPGALPCAAELLARLDVNLIILGHNEWEISHLGQHPRQATLQREQLVRQKQELLQKLEQNCPTSAPDRTQAIAAISPASAIVASAPPVQSARAEQATEATQPAQSGRPDRPWRTTETNHTEHGLFPAEVVRFRFASATRLVHPKQAKRLLAQFASAWNMAATKNANKMNHIFNAGNNNKIVGGMKNHLTIHNKYNITGVNGKPASRMTQHPHVLPSLTVVGHADMIGSHLHNLDLSRRRAELIIQKLRELHVHAHFKKIARAELDPVVTNCTTIKNRTIAYHHAKSSQRARATMGLITCLAPNRRVEMRASRVH